jgi:hypothetical protein
MHDASRRSLLRVCSLEGTAKYRRKSPVCDARLHQACHAGSVGYHDRVREVTGSATPTALAAHRPSFGAPTPTAVGVHKPSFGAALANGLAAATGALIHGTSRIFGQVASRGGHALAGFRARPEHSRWRAYALVSYGLVVAATFTGQLYTDNVLTAYVRVQRVDLPAITQIFVRNDSGKPWRDVKIVLNGIYDYRAEEVVPGGHIMLQVSKFAIRDPVGKAMRYAPKTLAPQTLLVATSAGRYETEFRE